MLRDLPAEQRRGSIQSYEVDLATGPRGQLARKIELGVKRQRLVTRQDRDVEIAVDACTLLGERAEQHREAQRRAGLEHTSGFVDQLVHIVEYTGRFWSGLGSRTQEWPTASTRSDFGGALGDPGVMPVTVTSVTGAPAASR